MNDEDGDVDITRIKEYLRNDMASDEVLNMWNNYIWRPIDGRRFDGKRNKKPSDLARLLHADITATTKTQGILIELWNVCTDLYLPRTKLHKTPLSNIVTGQ
jgi:hypothetical protein